MVVNATYVSNGQIVCGPGAKLGTYQVKVANNLNDVTIKSPAKLYLVHDSACEICSVKDDGTASCEVTVSLFTIFISRLYF